jgi:preflagellin peptidase FlaK
MSETEQCGHDLEAILSSARVVVSLVFLAYASWSDFKTREVSNNVWVAFAPTAFLLTFAQLLLYPPIGGDVLESMIFYGTSFAVTSIFALVLFYVGAFGGADAKALMCIALAMPEPSFMKPLTDFGFAHLQVSLPLSGYVSFIFPITVFSNGVIIAASSVVYTLIRNIIWRRRTDARFFEGYKNVSLGRKVLTLLCGYKVRVADLKKSFLYPLEDVRATQSGKTERLLLLFPKDESREEIIERLSQAEGEGTLKDAVWATPGLPMLIFITLGLIVALTVGDIVWIAISRIL